MGRRGILGTSLALGMAGAPLLLGGCAQTATYGTGQVPEMALFHEMTGGLLSRNDKKAPIDYQPRAPLVMPPDGSQLPPPTETASADSGGDWPIDPDKGGTTALASAEQTDKEGNPENAATPEEYRRLRPLAGVFPTQHQQTQPNNDVAQLRNSTYDFIHTAQGQHNTFSKALNDKDGFSETDRRYLTEPPLAYRQPADTAPAEYKGIGKEKGFWRRFFPGR